MKTNEIIRALQNMDCDACEHDPTCSHGNMCVIVREACERLALLEKEKEACFRLGQMDMQASVIAMLRDFPGYMDDDSGMLLAVEIMVTSMKVSAHD